MKNLFRGELIQLTAEEPGVRSKEGVRWQRDSEFHRLADGEPAMLFSEKKLKEEIEQIVERGFAPERYFFSIRALKEDALIGFLSLRLHLIHSDVMVGVGIGDRTFWGRGYGTEVMKMCLQYAFLELGAQRVTLGVHEYNPRAQRAYEKVGFRVEGRTRQDILRDGKRTDSIWMGILREEWLAMQEESIR